MCARAYIVLQSPRACHRPHKHYNLGGESSANGQCTRHHSRDPLARCSWHKLNGLNESPLICMLWERALRTHVCMLCFRYFWSSLVAPECHYWDYHSKPLQLPDPMLPQKVAACEKNFSRVNAEMAAFDPTARQASAALCNNLN